MLRSRYELEHSLRVAGRAVVRRFDHEGLCQLQSCHQDGSTETTWSQKETTALACLHGGSMFFSAERCSDE